MYSDMRPLQYHIPTEVTPNLNIHNSEVCHPVVCRKTNGDVNISHEITTMVVWIYYGL